MKPQFINYLSSSTILWLDNLLLKKGEAYFNVSTNFYPINQTYNGYYSYAAPYKQMVYDSSISGVDIITGVYLNNNFIGTGTSGFAGINYNEGLALFSTPINGAISGNYYAKEVNVQSISENQEKLLIENKFYNKNRSFDTTGNLTNQIPYPAIFIRNEGDSNEAFAFGGEDSDKNTFKLSIFADSQFQLDAIVQILKDSERTYYPVFGTNEFPFNQLGGLRSGIFNYNNYIAPKILDANSAYILDVQVTKFNSELMAEVKRVNPEIYVAIVDIKTEVLRYPRV